MNTEKFLIPVTVSAGVGTAITVSTVQEAHRFLLDWPPSRRGPLYWTARNCCEHVQLGLIRPDAFQKSFVEFAKNTGILIAAAQEEHPRAA